MPSNFFALSRSASMLSGLPRVRRILRKGRVQPQKALPGFGLVKGGSPSSVLSSLPGLSIMNMHNLPSSELASDQQIVRDYLSRAEAPRPMSASESADCKSEI